MKRFVVVLLVTAAALTACAPSAAKAQQNCLDSVMASWRADGEEVTLDVIDRAKDLCAENYTEDPEEFLRIWG
jgi:hypothetical protein